MTYNRLVVEISIELEDIIEGEKLKDTLIVKFEHKGLLLSERPTGLCSDDMPEITSLNKNKDQPELSVKYDNYLYTISLPELSDSILRTALSFLYGYGHVKYDYKLPVFQVLAEEDTVKYMELAVETWERNIHREWMRKCGYETHNGTKDEVFLYQILTDKQKAIETHRERSDNREKGDTSHHIFRNPEVLRLVMESKGEDELSESLIESMYDEATATTRYWYKLKKEQKQFTFEERLVNNMEKGYYITHETDTKSEVERWKPGVFGFTNDYETEMWQLWLRVHENFKDYWIEKFGKNEELWQPPAPLEILEKITERFK